MLKMNENNQLKRDVFFISISGGKDSTALLLKLIEDKKQIDGIYFVDTQKELPETYEIIKRLSVYCEEKINIPIITLTPQMGRSYYDYFYKVRKKGKYIGQIRGFPKVCFKCWWQRDCKDYLLKKVTKEEIKKGNILYWYVGFTSDELKRCKKYTNQIYPLVNYNMTEKDCMDYCKDKGWLNEAYIKYGFLRMGCYDCPKQKKKDLIQIKNNFPNLWEQMLKDEKDSPHGFHPKFKLGDI